MSRNDPDLTAPREAPPVRSAPRGRRSGFGELFAFLWTALSAVRDLWVAAPREPPVVPGDDRETP